MRKVWRKLLITFFIVSLFNLTVFANSNTYMLDELGIEITIPSNYDVITQKTSPSNPVFDRLGTTGSDLIKQFKTDNIYLNAIPKNNTNEEIVVTMATNIIDNFSALSDTSLKMFASSWVNEYEKMGISVSKYDIYHHSQAKFVRVYFQDTVNSVNGLQYYTIYNEKAMNFTMRSYYGEITSKQEQTIKTIVDSVKYDTPPIVVPAEAETEAFVYTDIDTNAKFTVPANWHEEELSKEREFIDVRFVSSKEEGMSIMYGSVDMWGMMTEEEKEGYVRSDMRNSAFTNELVAEMVGADESDVSKVFYNGKDYFQVTVKTDKEMYGANFKVEMTHVLRFENGWSYWFQFSGTTSNEYFTDFQELLNTVEYPYYKKPLLTTDNKKVLFFIFAILGIIFAITFFVERKIKENEEIKYKLENKTEEDIRCPNCNTVLLDKGGFCHKCGTRLDI